MVKQKHPSTPAVRLLRAAKVRFEPRLYDYTVKGGTAASSLALGVDEHGMIKTLIMEDDTKKPLVVLMHGDCEVSTKKLARYLGVKSVAPCAPAVADRHSGYRVGGTSPFGTRKQMPVYIQRTILDLQSIFINGGARGFLVELDPQLAARLLGGVAVELRA